MVSKQAGTLLVFSLTAGVGYDNIPKSLQLSKEK